MLWAVHSLSQMDYVELLSDFTAFSGASRQYWVPILTSLPISKYRHIGNIFLLPIPILPILKNVPICRYCRYRYWYRPIPTDNDVHIYHTHRIQPLTWFKVSFPWIVGFIPRKKYVTKSTSTKKCCTFSEYKTYPRIILRLCSQSDDVQTCNGFKWLEVTDLSCTMVAHIPERYESGHCWVTHCWRDLILTSHHCRYCPPSKVQKNAFTIV